MELSQLIKEQKKKVDELWNEHDGTHFYKDEFIAFLSTCQQELLQKVKEIIESQPDTFSELESNDYDNGAKRMKKEIIQSLKI